MSIKFSHTNRNTITRAGTIAVEMPTKELVTLSPTIENKQLAIKVGYSLLHEGDRYNRKVGKEIAQSKLRKEMATLMSTRFNKERDIYDYEITRTNGNKVFFGLSVSPTSENVHLEYAYFE